MSPGDGARAAAQPAGDPDALSVTGDQPFGDHPTGDCYEIILARQLGRRTAALFPGLELSEIPGDGMRLRGAFTDQAALHGVLARIRDLGIPLLEVRRLPPEECRGRA